MKDKTKAAPAAEEEKNLEESMQELSDIIREMEGGTLSLEDTFDLYKKGMGKLRHCNEMIDRVEKDLEVLEEGGEVDDEQ